VIGENAVGPAVLLLEDDSGRTGAPLLGAEAIIGRGRPQKHRADAPDDAARPRRARQQEEALRGVAEAAMRADSRRRLLPVHQRHDGPHDQIPLLVQLERNDRLDVERVATALRRP
jgi:hypothetical protein